MNEELKNSVPENTENIAADTEITTVKAENTEPAPLSPAAPNKNIIKCKTCGTEIAKSAKACPSCGAKNKKPIYKRVWFWAIIVMVLLLIIANAGGDDDNNGGGISVSVGAPVINGTTAAPDETTKKADQKETLADAQKVLDEGNPLGAYDIAISLEQTEEVKAFVEKCRTEALAQFDGQYYWQEDEMSDYHWVFINGQDCDLDSHSFCGYVSQSKANPYDLGFHMYTGFIRSIKANWIFPTTMRIKGEGGTIDIPISYSNRHSEVENSKLTEWVNMPLDRSTASSLALLLLSSENVTIRYSGSEYYVDYELSEKDLKDMQTALLIYTAMEHVYQ